MPRSNSSCRPRDSMRRTRLLLVVGDGGAQQRGLVGGLESNVGDVRVPPVHGDDGLRRSASRRRGRGLRLVATTGGAARAEAARGPPVEVDVICDRNRVAALL